MSTRFCGLEGVALLLASASVQPSPSASGRVAKPQKIFANEALYQLSYTPQICGRQRSWNATGFKRSEEPGSSGRRGSPSRAASSRFALSLGKHGRFRTPECRTCLDATILLRPWSELSACSPEG